MIRLEITVPDCILEQGKAQQYMDDTLAAIGLCRIPGTVTHTMDASLAPSTQDVNIPAPEPVAEEEAPKPARKPRQSRKASVEAAPEPETTSEPEEEEAPATDEDDIPFGLTPVEEVSAEDEASPEQAEPVDDENTVKAPTPDLKALIAESKKAEATQEKPEDFLPPGTSDDDAPPVKPATPKGGLFAHLKR